MGMWGFHVCGLSVVMHVCVHMCLYVYVCAHVWVYRWGGFIGGWVGVDQWAGTSVAVGVGDVCGNLPIG